MTITFPSAFRRARWFARAAVALTLVAGVPAVPGLAGVADAAEPWERVVDLTFPTVPGSRFSNDYHAPRSGGARMHCATDIIGRKHQPVYAAVGGVITSMPLQKPSYGYAINVRGDDGRRYSYIHLNDDTPGTHDASAGPEHAYAPGLQVGSRVHRGQHIGYLGNSGNAKGGVDHLHFEIHDPDVHNPACTNGGGADRMNPAASLLTAVQRGDHGGAPRPPAVPARGIDGACPASLTATAFSDSAGTHARAVSCIAGWGIAAGVGDGRFEPARPVTREQLATFVVNLLDRAGRPLPAASRDHFHDDGTSTHHDAVNRIADAGIVNGVGEGRFAPGGHVSRGQMATVLASTYTRVTGSTLPVGDDAFADDHASVHQENINRLAAARVATGYADGGFRPLGAVSRAEMATFIARTLDLLIEQRAAALPA